MKWNDKGIVLSAKKYSESGLILAVMTANHGNHKGLVRWGNSKTGRSLYQPGNMIQVSWNARLEDHLGSFRCELVKTSLSEFLSDPLKLAALSSICALTELSFPEREPHPVFYGGLEELLLRISEPNWTQRYVTLELLILSELGFGLDLAACAVSGMREELVYVSPKTGRAVSKDAGAPYRKKLKVLPEFLLNQKKVLRDVSLAEIYKGLSLSGYFLDRHIFSQRTRREPSARTRFVDRIKQMSTISSM